MAQEVYKDISRYWEQGIGALITITGCMKSGKTTELLRALEDCTRAGIPYRLFTHSYDQERRTGVATNRNAYGSHDGILIPERFFTHTSDLEVQLNGERTVLGLNEVQFADAPILSFLERQMELGNIVVAAGLNMTSEDKPFPLRAPQGEREEISTATMADILAMSTDIYTLHAKCEYVEVGVRCKFDAAFSRSRTPKTTTVQVGSKNYTVRCIKHKDMRQFPYVQ
jgi:thymidine kinase